MAILFIENKHIVLKDMTSVVKDYSFARLPIIKKDKTIIEKIILFMYKNNI